MCCFSPVVMYGWELDCEESWAPKNLCFWTVVLEKTLESPLDYKEIQPVHPKGDQPWDFFGGNNAKAETPILWPSHVKSWLIGKDPDAGRDWGKEKRRTEDKMAGWHHWLNGHGFEWTPGVGDGQGGLVLRFIGSQRVGHNWATELKHTECFLIFSLVVLSAWNAHSCLIKRQTHTFHFRSLHLIRNVFQIIASLAASSHFSRSWHCLYPSFHYLVYEWVLVICFIVLADFLKCKFIED